MDHLPTVSEPYNSERYSIVLLVCELRKPTWQATGVTGIFDEVDVLIRVEAQSVPTNSYQPDFIDLDDLGTDSAIVRL